MAAEQCRFRFRITEDTKISVPIPRKYNGVRVNEGVTFSVEWPDGTTKTYNVDDIDYNPVFNAVFDPNNVDPEHGETQYDVSVTITAGSVTKLGYLDWPGVGSLHAMFIDNIRTDNPLNQTYDEYYSTWGMSSNGSDTLENIDYLFAHTTKLYDIPPSCPRTLTSMKGLFMGSANNLTKIKDISITDVASYDEYGNQIPVVKWVIENVKDMSYAFSYCDFTEYKDKVTFLYHWRGYIPGGWDEYYYTSGPKQLENMEGMFKGSNFEVANGVIYDNWGQLGGWTYLDYWRVSHVTNMKSLFEDSNYNGRLIYWDVRKVETMERMFYNTKNFSDNSNFTDITFEYSEYPMSNCLALWEPISCKSFKEMFYDVPYFGNIQGWTLGDHDIDFTDMLKGNSQINKYFNEDLIDTPTKENFNKPYCLEIDGTNENGDPLIYYREYENGNFLRFGDYIIRQYDTIMIYIDEFYSVSTRLGKPLYQSTSVSRSSYKEAYYTDEEGVPLKSYKLYLTHLRDSKVFLKDERTSGSSLTPYFTLCFNSPYLGVEKEMSIDFARALFESVNLFEKSDRRVTFGGDARNIDTIGVGKTNLIVYEEGIINPLPEGKTTPTITVMEINSFIPGVDDEGKPVKYIPTEDQAFNRSTNIIWTYNFKTIELNSDVNGVFDTSKYLFVDTLLYSEEQWLKTLEDVITPPITWPSKTVTDLAYSDDHPMGKCCLLDLSFGMPEEYVSEDVNGDPITVRPGLLYLSVPFDNFESILTSKRLACTIDDLHDFYSNHLPLEEGRSFAVSFPRFFNQNLDTQAKFDEAKSQIHIIWKVIQGQFGDFGTYLNLLKGARIVYYEEGYVNMPPDGNTEKKISYLQFEDNGLITNNEDINPDTLEAAVYIIAFFVPREGIIKDNDDFKTKIDAWYVERDRIGDNENGVKAANTLPPGNPFFWQTAWDKNTFTSFGTSMQNKSGNNHPDLRYIKVSDVTDMSSVFLGSNFNSTLVPWERTLPVSSTFKKVTTMDSMFKNAPLFNQDLSGWDVSNVESMMSVFEGAKEFNNGGSNDIKDWNVENCKNFKNMFFGAENFDRIIVNWIVKAYPQGTTSKYVFPDGEEVNVGDDDEFGPNVRQMVYNSKLYNDESDPFGQGFYKIAKGASDSNGDLDGTPKYSLFGKSICFNKGTQILCMKNNQEVYVAVEHLRKGDLVKTLNDGYKPIQTLTVGTFTLGRPMDMGMYKMKQEGSMMADLEMTGLHSILVNENDEEHADDVNRQITTQPNRKLYVKDHFRLHANYSSKFEKMPTSAYTIYSFSLEGQEAQYGIWANGVLVESTSNDYVLSGAMKEVLEHNENTKKE
jgi:hypothetical protein